MHLLMRLLGKKGRRMKNAKKRGKSARNGNAPAPYTKYNKSPYKYYFSGADKKNKDAEYVPAKYKKAA